MATAGVGVGLGVGVCMADRCVLSSCQTKREKVGEGSRLLTFGQLLNILFRAFLVVDIPRSLPTSARLNFPLDGDSARVLLQFNLNCSFRLTVLDKGIDLGWQRVETSDPGGASEVADGRG